MAIVARFLILCGVLLSGVAVSLWLQRNEDSSLRTVYYVGDAPQIGL